MSDSQWEWFGLNRKIMTMTEIVEMMDLMKGELIDQQKLAEQLFK